VQVKQRTCASLLSAEFQPATPDAVSQQGNKSKAHKSPKLKDKDKHKDKDRDTEKHDEAQSSAVTNSGWVWMLPVEPCVSPATQSAWRRVWLSVDASAIW
jgi:hypothetical protein